MKYETKRDGDWCDKYGACKVCGGENVSKSFEKEQFDYGPEKVPTVTVDVTLPVFKCESCGDRWTDSEAEDLCTEALIRTLVNEVIRLRKELAFVLGAGL